MDEGAQGKLEAYIRRLRRGAGLNTAEMKQDINTLVWRHLPGDTTLDQADAVACAIYDILTEERL